MNKNESKVKKSKGLATAIAIVIAVIVVLGTAIYVVVDANNPEKKLAKQLNIANKYLEAEDYERAIAAFDKAIDFDPKCVDAYLGKAEAYVALDNYEEAIAILEEGYDETSDIKLFETEQKIEQQWPHEAGWNEKQDETNQDLSDDSITTIEEFSKSINTITIKNVGAVKLSENRYSEYYFDEYPEVLWKGALGVYASYGENGEIDSYILDGDNTIMCDSLACINCGQESLDSIIDFDFGEFVGIDVSFKYSNTEEIKNQFDKRIIIYNDAIITDLTVYYGELVDDEPYTFELKSKVWIQNGEVVGHIPF